MKDTITVDNIYGTDRSTLVAGITDGLYPAYPDPQSKLANAYPDNNPKTSIGVTKVPLHLVPPVAGHYTALAFADGARKYGPYNWREKKVSTSVYIAAMKRHIDAYWDGEDVSKDANVHHLGHVMACCAIILDGMSIGMLNDDRPPKGAAARLQDEYANKEQNDRETSAGIPANPLPASDLQGSLFPVESEGTASRDVARDSRSLRSECSNATFKELYGRREPGIFNL